MIVNAVARAISAAIEDAILDDTQFVTDEHEDFLNGPDGVLHLKGDTGEMRNAPNGLTSEFTIELSDGSKFNVKVTPQA